MKFAGLNGGDCRQPFSRAADRATVDGRRLAGARHDRCHRARAAAAVHQASGLDQRSRSVSDRLCPRARIDRGADGRPAFHAGDSRGAPRQGRRARRASRCMSVTERSSRSASRASTSIRWRRSITKSAPRPPHRCRQPREKGGASLPSARPPRARSSRSPLRRMATVSPGSGETALFIHPGHDFRLVSGLITNFHLPKSSLLMLVSAFAGRERDPGRVSRGGGQPLSVL